MRLDSDKGSCGRGKASPATVQITGLLFNNQELGKESHFKHHLSENKVWAPTVRIWQRVSLKFFASVYRKTKIPGELRSNFVLPNMVIF